jgi:hypothetical protein
MIICMPQGPACSSYQLQTDDTMYPETEQTELQALIHQFQPQQILSIGPAGQELFTSYLVGCLECSLQECISVPTLEQLDGYGRYDLVFVSHVLESMPKSQAEQLIARLRDLHSERLIIVLPIGKDWPGHASHWQQTDMLGLGFSRVAKFQYKQHLVHIYAFDIASYKTTPEWLNSKYWANPEMFDKYWW